MSSTYNDLRHLKKFLEENVCNRIRFKVPDDQFQDQTYRLEIDHPVVSVLRTELKEYGDRLAKAPQIVIRLLETNENRWARTKEYSIQLLVITWNTGTSTSELYYPDPVKDRKGIPISFETREQANEIISTENGSYDVLNFVDMITEALMSHVMIGPNLSFNQEEGISSGPMFDEDGPARLEPYYVHWVQFSMKAIYDRPLTDFRDGL